MYGVVQVVHLETMVHHRLGDAVEVVTGIREYSNYVGKYTCRLKPNFHIRIFLCFRDSDHRNSERYGNSLKFQIVTIVC